MKRFTVTLIALAMLAGCTSTPVAPALRCYPVAASWLTELNVRLAQTIRAPERDGAWIVAGENGAVWIISEDPRFDTGGLGYPLNDKARATSTLGIDVTPDAPILHGITMTEPGVAETLACAISERK